MVVWIGSNSVYSFPTESLNTAPRCDAENTPSCPNKLVCPLFPCHAFRVVAHFSVLVFLGGFFKQRKCRPAYGCQFLFGFQAFLKGVVAQLCDKCVNGFLIRCVLLCLK
jgi:hypothetical protein